MEYEGNIDKTGFERESKSIYKGKTSEGLRPTRDELDGGDVWVISG